MCGECAMESCANMSCLLICVIRLADHVYQTETCFFTIICRIDQGLMQEMVWEEFHLSFLPQNGAV